MIRFVLDNSVTMRWLFRDGTVADLDYAERVLEKLTEGIAVVPHIWQLEVANVIVRAEAKAGLAESRSRVFLAMLGQMQIVVDDTADKQTWETILPLARQFRLSSYDAAYLELAIREDLPLASLDSNLISALKQAKVKLFAS